MTTYSRSLPPDSSSEQVESAKSEVAAHLSAVVDPHDDDQAHIDHVNLRVEGHETEVKVIGDIEAEPSAPYLEDDFDPEDEAQENPLNVSSEFGEPSNEDGTTR